MAIIDCIEVHNKKKDSGGSFLEKSFIDNNETIKFQIKKYNPETGQELSPVTHAECTQSEIQNEWNRIKNQLDTIESFCSDENITLMTG